MTLIVKLMTDGDVADSDTRATHKLLTGVSSVEFDRDKTGQAFAHAFFMDDSDPETYQLSGNCYVMNEQGKTVSSFGCSPPPPPASDEPYDLMAKQSA